MYWLCDKLYYTLGIYYPNNLGKMRCDDSKLKSYWIRKKKKYVLGGWYILFYGGGVIGLDCVG